MPTFLSFPEKASSIAGSVNILLLAMLAVGFIIAIVIALLAFSALVGGEAQEEEGSASEKDQSAPLLWSLGIGVVIIIFFLWSSMVYLNNIKTPADAEDVISVAKHWVWKFQHTPDGKGEIDELHVVVGKPVRLIMTSQDTTHSIFAPGFMQQQDILPGKFTAMWFTATKAGEFPFYTTQYSGTGFTKMAGKIVAMEQADYDAWLSGKTAPAPGGGGEAAGGDVAVGQQLFTEIGCSGCHSDQDSPVAPTLHDIYGSDISLADGSTVTVDDAYLHESIVDPGAKLVKGYGDIMPKNYATDLSEEQIQALMAYIKSLSGVTQESGETSGGGEAAGATPGSAMELSADAMAIYTDNGCNACHGQNLEGMIGPNLAGLSADYVQNTVRTGVEGTAMAAYGPDKISDDDLATLAQGIESLSFAATGMQVNPTVAGHLQEAAQAFEAGDMDGTKAGLEAALAACGQMGGQVTLKTMIRKTEEGDVDYLKMRFDILLAGKGAEGAAPAPAAEPTKAPEPTAEAEAPSEGGVNVPTVPGDPVKGEETFVSLGCNACHTDQDTPVAPTLEGLYGNKVQIEGKPPVLADDAYIIQSITDPGVMLVKGYGPLMPATFASLEEQELADLLAYIQSLAQ